MKRTTSIFFSERKICSFLKGQLQLINVNHKFAGGVYAPPMYFKKMKANGSLVAMTEAMFINAN